MISGARPLVLVGPSGAGKTTIARKLVEEHPHRFAFSVSVTTRKPRGQEQSGYEYLFVSREAFREMIDAGKLAEWATVHGEYYGTPAEGVLALGSDGRTPVLDIDVQGARQVAAQSRDALVIFILPPSPRVWIERLAGRGTESREEIDRRLATAVRELRAAPEFERYLVNERVDRAVLDVLALVDGQRTLRTREEVHALCRSLEAGARTTIERLGKLVVATPDKGGE